MGILAMMAAVGAVPVISVPAAVSPGGMMTPNESNGTVLKQREISLKTEIEKVSLKSQVGPDQTTGEKEAPDTGDDTAKENTDSDVTDLPDYNLLENFHGRDLKSQAAGKECKDISLSHSVGLITDDEAAEFEHEASIADGSQDALIDYLASGSESGPEVKYLLGSAHHMSSICSAPALFSSSAAACETRGAAMPTRPPEQCRRPASTTANYSGVDCQSLLELDWLKGGKSKAARARGPGLNNRRHGREAEGGSRGRPFTSLCLLEQGAVERKQPRHDHSYRKATSVTDVHHL